jgi:pyruvate dehydrogenase E1 component alpha subunit
MNAELGRQLLFQMSRIRLVEEEIAKRYAEGKMRCPTHLSIGQEGVAAAAGLALRRTDLAVSGHRAHAHYLAKGGDLRAMIAEIYGKVTGCARGKGGSMHLVDEAAGFKGSTAIVAGTVPVGVGLAYAMKLRKEANISCVFLGDAVVEAGVFFEAANFAVLKNLPVLFVCENNLYSVYSPLSVRQPEGRAIHDLVRGIGIRAECGDGNDAVAVHELVAATVARIRAGAGPAFLEFSTYRWREHCGPNYDNDLGYRTEAEYLQWKEREPIARLRSALRRQAALADDALGEMERRIRQEIEEAFRFAEASPFPTAEDAYTDVYASPVQRSAAAGNTL